MAKKNNKKSLIRLISSAGTGYIYVKKKSASKKKIGANKNKAEKLVLLKYDPVVRKHVEFKEDKIK